MLGLANYMIYLKTGTLPFSSLPDLSPSSLIPNKSTVTNIVNKVSKEVPSNSEPGKVYKWTDEKGKVHYSTEPAQNTAVEEVKVNLDANIVKRFEVPKKEEAKLPQNSAATSQENVPVSVNAYDPETIQQLIKDAKEVQTLMDERNEKINQTLDSL